MSCTENFVPVINTPTPADGVVVSGNIVGSTLILDTSTGGTVNVPLVGIEGAIDFNNLSPTQIDALSFNLRGNLAVDSFGVQLGYWLEL